MCASREALHKGLLCNDRAPRTARALLKDWICDRHSACCLNDALLLLSEVVTNAVIHAGPPLEVDFRFDTETDLRIAVHDGQHGLSVPLTPLDEVLPEVDDPEKLPEHGRGLPLVEMLATDWSLEPDEQGKTFAFSLACVDC